MLETQTSSGTGPSDLHILCPDCEYNLTGLTADRCPWCGWIIKYDQLTRDDLPQWGRRAVVGITCAFTGGAALLAEYVLYRRNVRLTMLDAFPILGVFLAAAGHLLLAGVAVSGRGSWPMRRGELSGSLGWAAWLSILLGIGGASATLQLAPTPLHNQHGVQVNGFFEFILAGIWFSLPGILLLFMRLVAFREPPPRLSGTGSAPQADADQNVAQQRKGRAPFRVEAYGFFDRGQLTQTSNAPSRPRNAEIERAVAEAWEAEMALAQASEKVLYNGRLARLDEISINQGRLHLVLGPTDYRALVGTHFHNTELVQRVGAEHFADALGVSLTVLTVDGYLAFGRRGPRVVYHAGFLHTFGGVVEEKDRDADGDFNLFGCALRELCEELHIHERQVSELVAVGVVRDTAMHQPELMFEAVLSSTRRELEASFDATMDAEHARLEFVHADPDGIVPFITRMAPITPVAQAALLLFGRRQWGEHWYEQTCFVLYGDTAD